MCQEFSTPYLLPFLRWHEMDVFSLLAAYFLLHCTQELLARPKGVATNIAMEDDGTVWGALGKLHRPVVGATRLNKIVATTKEHERGGEGEHSDNGGDVA